MPRDGEQTKEVKRLEKEGRIKVEKNERKEKNAEFCMHRDIQRDGEIKERDTEMKKQMHICTSREKAERRPRSKCRRNALTQDHTYSCTGCPLNNSKECHFHLGHNVTEPP